MSRFVPFVVERPGGPAGTTTDAPQEQAGGLAWVSGERGRQILSR